MRRRNFIKLAAIVAASPAVVLTEDKKYVEEMEWEGGCKPYEPISVALEDAKESFREVPWSHKDSHERIEDSEFEFDPDGRWEDYDDGPEDIEERIVFYLFKVKITAKAKRAIDKVFNS